MISQPANSSVAPILQVKNLKTWFYTGAGIIKAVNGISYDLFPGEALAIVGESGSGKSVSALSLVRLIASPPGRIVEGEVLFSRRDLLQVPLDQLRRIRGNEIGMVFQDPLSSLNPVLPIGLQVAEALCAHKGLSKRAARNRAIDLLGMVGIPSPASRLDDFPHQFSGGMRQRVIIAMAISCEPKLLIADEPTTALDVTIQAQILTLLKRLQTELHMALILITHDLGIVAATVDRVNVMYGGYLVETGPVEVLFDDPRHPYMSGLKESLPSIVGSRAKRLVAIEGAPPDMISPPAGCPFVPRCKYRLPRCEVENPSLVMVSEDHASACWADLSHAGSVR